MLNEEPSKYLLCPPANFLYLTHEKNFLYPGNLI